MIYEFKDPPAEADTACAFDDKCSWQKHCTETWMYARYFLVSKTAFRSWPEHRKILVWKPEASL